MTRFRQTQGFTLIELLVVIAIIALLISILLPSLSRARCEGIKVRCGSGVRQMYMSFMMYAQDNRSRLPDNYHWLCDKALHGVKTNGKGFGFLIGAGYVEDSFVYCPGRTYTSHPYWYNRQAGYCYNVPHKYQSTNKNAKGPPRVPIPRDWIALLACRTDGATANPNVSNNRGLLPHCNTGLNILVRDGSVQFLPKPAWGGWGFSWNKQSNQKNWDHFSLLWSDKRITYSTK